MGPSSVCWETAKDHCEYCGTLTQPTLLRIKRSVPLGAKDLGLYDECWDMVCPRCESRSHKRIPNCLLCGQVGVYNAWTEQRGQLAVLQPVKEAYMVEDFTSQRTVGGYCETCSAQPCASCGKPIACVASIKRAWGMVHKQCEIARWQRLFDGFNEPRLKHRKDQGLCQCCSKPLNFFDKLKRKIKHDEYFGRDLPSNLRGTVARCDHEEWEECCKVHELPWQRPRCEWDIR